MQHEHDAVEQAVRQRVRSLRQTHGWSLAELAGRCGINASTLSRIENGERRLTVSHLVDLARALGTSVDELLGADAGEVVIRPQRTRLDGGVVMWPLTRAPDPSGRVVAKVRYPARRGPLEAKVHPGRDWFYVIEGTARLVLGDREHLVSAGQAADFDTLVPHAIAGHGAAVEVLMIFDGRGSEVHLRPGTGRA